MSDLRLGDPNCAARKRDQGATTRSADRSVVETTRPSRRLGTLHPEIPLSLPADPSKSRECIRGSQVGDLAPAATRALLRSSHWSGRPKNHWFQRVGCLCPGGWAVPVSRKFQHAIRPGCTYRQRRWQCVVSPLSLRSSDRPQPCRALTWLTVGGSCHSVAAPICQCRCLWISERTTRQNQFTEHPSR